MFFIIITYVERAEKVMHIKTDKMNGVSVKCSYFY